MVVEACVNECEKPDTSNLGYRLVDLNAKAVDSCVSSPVVVTWSPAEKGTLQIYRDGLLVGERDNTCPGIEGSLDSGYYEFKLWQENKVSKTTWAEVSDCSSLDATSDTEGVNSILDFDVDLSGSQLYSPLSVVWSCGQRDVLVNFEGEEHRIRKGVCPGVSFDLVPGYYEFILAGQVVPDDTEQSIWTSVRDPDVQPIDHSNVQITNEWQMTPGAACEPKIEEYETIYERYLEADNSSPQYTELVADADALRAESTGSGPFIVHNTASLTVASWMNDISGTHQAQYSFQIPSLETGQTVDGGLMIWYGQEDIRTDYGVAFQLIVDQDSANAGRLYKRTDSGWGNTGITVPLATSEWYRIEFILDVENRAAKFTLHDATSSFEVSDAFVEDKKDVPWSYETVSRLTAECISKDSIRHVIRFKDFEWNII